MEYALTTTGLTKKYGKHTVLDDVSIHIPRGSVYGIVGRNGAGKTTLMRVICGLQKPDKGGYSILGIENSDKNIWKSRRRTGAVIGTPGICNDMSAEENLKQQCISLGLPDFSSVKRLIELVGLEKEGRKHAGRYSLGMRQRLGIAIALTGNPDLIILDEPLNGLDPQAITETRELILKLSHEQNITFLISSHILEELSKVADKYGFIENGKLIKETDASELEKMLEKSYIAEVSDTKILSYVLDREKCGYEIISDTQARIWGDMTLSKLSRLLEAEKCELITFSCKNQSLEDYFLELVGGASYE